MVDYRGVSPVVVKNLTPGEHQVRTSKMGYFDNNSTQVIGSDKRESIHVIRIGNDGSGEVLNTTFIGHDQERNLDYFMAESPDGLSTFGLASISKGGNLFRLLYLVIAQSVIPQTGGSSGNSGGVGGGGGSSIKSSVPPPTPVQTLTQGPTQTSLPTIPPGAKGSGSQVTGSPTSTKPPTPSLTPTPTNTHPYSPIPDPAPIMVLLKNLSVVFVVVLVTLVFYLRWHKREQ